jgi:hypothetical protein
MWLMGLVCTLTKRLDGSSIRPRLVLIKSALSVTTLLYGKLVSSLQTSIKRWFWCENLKLFNINLFMEVEIFTWKRYLAIYCEGKKIMVYIMSYDR